MVLGIKLICSACNHVYTDAPESAEGLTCELQLDEGDDLWCQGTLKYLYSALPMIGDPPEASPLLRGFYDSTLDRKKLLYEYLMKTKAAKQPAKTAIVPESLRRGLWAHIW